MSSSGFRERYQVLQSTGAGPTQSFHAMASTGAVVMVHFLAGDPHAIQRILAMIERLRPAERKRVIEITEDEGRPIVVTRFILDFTSFDDWLNLHQQDTAVPSEPPPMRPETVEPAASPDGPGEFTRMFGRVSVPAEPAAAPPPPKPPAESAGDFTRMFGRPSFEPPAAVPPAPVTPLPPPPSPSFPRTFAEPLPSTPAPPPQSPQNPSSGFTELFAPPAHPSQQGATPGGTGTRGAGPDVTDNYLDRLYSVVQPGAPSMDLPAGPRVPPAYPALPGQLPPPVPPPGRPAVAGPSEYTQVIAGMSATPPTGLPSALPPPPGPGPAPAAKSAVPLALVIGLAGVVVLVAVIVTLLLVLD